MSIPLKNDRLLRALLGQKVDRTPVWIMRQAGRYLPEYRRIRRQAGSFMALCKNPELACEVTLQPLERYPLDAAILFSDILTVPAAMGLDLEFVTGEGPVFANPIRSLSDVQALASPDPESELRYVIDAARAVNLALQGRVPLIGFAGSPWTVATYMVEGGSSRNFAKIKGMLFDSPDCLHQLLERVTAVTINYLNAQIRAGAQAVMIFDTWGGVLSLENYRRFSLEYMGAIVDALIKEHKGRVVPNILFTKHGGHGLEYMVDTQCHGIGLDWTSSLASARQRTGGRVALQGNLDPCVLYASDEVIRAEVKKVLKEYGHGSGHVFNLGHGIHPQVEPEKVAVLIDAVHKYSPDFHDSAVNQALN